MQGRIAKAVVVALTAEASGIIEDYRIQHMVKTILDCGLPKVQLQATHMNFFSAENANHAPITTLFAAPPAAFPGASVANKSQFWANITSKTTSNQPKIATKPLLQVDQKMVIPVPSHGRAATATKYASYIQH